MTARRPVLTGARPGSERGCKTAGSGVGLRQAVTAGGRRMAGASGRAMVLAAMLGFAGCSPRGEIVLDPAATAVGTPGTVIVASARAEVDGPPYFLAERSDRLNFARFEVSVPPERKVGTVTFPRHGKADPQKDFVVVAEERLDGEAGFIRAVNRMLAADPARSGDASLFVHGYNTNFAEGLFRQAQIQHDLERAGASIQFAWPSKAKAEAYLYDRESVLFSRDALEATIRALTRTEARDITLFAHSMGSLLLMDTLRTMARDPDDRVLGRIGAVVLISADIEVDVFRKQAPPVLARGIPIYLLISDKDKALEISALLRGEKDRVGSIRSPAELGGLDVTVIDLTNVASVDAMGHLKEAESPAVIEFAQKLRTKGVVPFDTGGDGAFLRGGISLVQQGAAVVLQPLVQ